MSKNFYCLGLMSGTSMDGIDGSIIYSNGIDKFEVIENIQLEQRINLYSDYLEQPKNIDVDYTISAFMKVNDYLSTNLIIQCLYDENAIKKVQLRDVFGLAINLNLMELPTFK